MSARACDAVVSALLSLLAALVCRHATTAGPRVGFDSRGLSLHRQQDRHRAAVHARDAMGLARLVVMFLLWRAHP